MLRDTILCAQALLKASLQLAYSLQLKYGFLQSLKAQHILQNYPKISSFFWASVLFHWSRSQSHEVSIPIHGEEGPGHQFRLLWFKNLSLQRVERGNSSPFTPMESYPLSINLFLENYLWTQERSSSNRKHHLQPQEYGYKRTNV